MPRSVCTGSPGDGGSTARRVPIRPEGRTPLHIIRTLGGDLVRSRAEARIANVLHRSGNLVIESWALDMPEFNERRHEKTMAYLSEGHKLLGLEPRHWAALEDKLARKLARFDQDLRLPATNV